MQLLRDILFSFSASAHSFSSPRRHHLQWGVKFAVLLSSVFSSRVQAGATPLVVLAAADMASVLPKIIKSFETENLVPTRLVFGSSGHFTRQIREGLAFDLFCSADRQLIDQLAKEGKMAGPARPLALGRLALVSRLDLSTRGASALSASSVAARLAKCRKLAIANPSHAPYGRAAQEVLSQWGLWEVAQSKLVMADNAAQAAQFILQGAVQMALVPVALLPPPQARLVEWTSGQGATPLLVQKIPSTLHAALQQGIGLVPNPSNNAQRLAQHLLAAPAQALLREHGFDPVVAG